MTAPFLAASLAVLTAFSGPALAARPTPDTAPGESCGQGNASFCDDDDDQGGGGSTPPVVIDNSNTNNVGNTNTNTNNNSNSSSSSSSSNSSSSSSSNSNSASDSSANSYSGGSSSSVKNNIRNTIRYPRQQVGVPNVPGPASPDSVPTLTFYYQRDVVGPVYGGAISIPLK